jgi:uncharacterized membrane protein
MSENARFALATLCGLMLAALVHIGAVLSLPYLSEQDAYSRLRATLASERSELIAGTGPGAVTWLPQPDGATAVAACAYDLAEGPMRVATRTGSMFESLSFHSRGGGVYFAVTDRAAARGTLNLVIMTRRQIDEALAREDEAAPSRDVRIVAPAREGLVIVRVLAAYPSQRPLAEELAKTVSCTTEPDPTTQG